MSLNAVAVVCLLGISGALADQYAYKEPTVPDYYRGKQELFTRVLRFSIKKYGPAILMQNPSIYFIQRCSRQSLLLSLILAFIS